jgi:hypothetical protein
MESITNRLDQAEERMSGIEDKVEELLHSDSNKEKSNHDHNIKDHWNTIKLTKSMNLWYSRGN